MTDKLAYGAGTTDLSSAVQRLRGAEAAVVLHTGYQNDIVLFYRQMRQVGWFPRMIIGAGGGYSLTDTASTIGAGFRGHAGRRFPAVCDRSCWRARAAGGGGRRMSGSMAPSRAAGTAWPITWAPSCSSTRLRRAGRLDKDKVRDAVLAIDVRLRTTANGWGARFDGKGQNTLAWPVVAQWQGGVLKTVLPADSAIASLRPRLGA